tara:strand:+ start:12701 stop:13999 length:1299 start_codon:yes stop_codon:yes gene_type:complete
LAEGNAQQRFFEFLQKKQKQARHFSKAQVIGATGWKPNTFKTYFGKGQITQFVTLISEDTYEAINTLDISFIEFKKRLSQSKHFQELGHKCKSNLAKALLKKSRDNMMLALELYNRPSLENKLDGFVMLFSTSWEQLLKAIIIEKDGENSIYRPARKKGFKETISLRDCLNKLFKETDQIRKNIERIADWRDNAVHLLMPELQGLASRIFQSGVLNYSSQFESFAETAFLNSQHSGMLSLVGDFKLPPASLLKTYYGNAADEILELAKATEEAITNSNDIEFAIPINVSLVYAKDGDTIIATASGKSADLKNLKNALIVNKTINPEESHPLTQSAAIDAIKKGLFEKFDSKKLSKCLVAKCKKTGDMTFNPNCFQACLYKLNWKSENNEFHYYQALANKHIFSYEAVNEIIRRITQNDNFLSEAKNKWNSKK